jgi:RHH-type proline utilization regulon transcriptional repressor/proline dehydrogenase/delta 1-pyrroline-5-carboxylate dehydrogenase
VRRLLENGANSSFVNNIVDENVSLESLLESPVDYLDRKQQLRHPGIALPHAIYPNDRKNSKGLDLSHLPDRQAIDAALAGLQSQLPLMQAEGEAYTVSNPATGAILGSWAVCNDDAIDTALAKAIKAQEAWGALSVAERADCLLRLADAIEQRMVEFIALLILEAGKTRADAIAEVREAVDFCRYYAEQSQKLDAAAMPRGVVFCISPWNFPQAIFLGQVVAALACGNTVLAKPAEQTSMIAIKTIELFAQCGFVEGCVQLLLGPGAPIGQLLLPEAGIAAVMFTGSTATARLIAKTLAERDGPRVPLIAETGGQNCMLVDSSALPEQLVDDVVNSAFRSAGQRCSALRVLYLQEEIADAVIEMLKGAMRELCVGDPVALATDVGPVIDERALAGLQKHIARMGNDARAAFTVEANTDDRGHFVMPHLFEIDSIAQLDEEVFGPVLHVVRYRAEDLNVVFSAINSTGFGLTAGVHSRIENTANAFAANVKAGNIYVNRNTIGAVVGVQPFGGRGMSGTGPKAGGPNYLTRLVRWPQVSMAQATEAMEFESKLAGSIAPAEQWLQLSFSQRLTHLGPLLAQLQTRMAVEGADLIAAFENIVQNFSWQASRLQGPTGEDNVLLYEPRGRILCLSEAPVGPAWYFHALCNLLAGNILLLPKNTGAESYLRSLEVLGLQSRVEVIDYNDQYLLEQQNLHGVCASGNEHYLAAIDRLLQQRDGAMLPLISELSLTAVMPRLLSEKVISTDTTAAGGNASLLVMED